MGERPEGLELGLAVPSGSLKDPDHWSGSPTWGDLWYLTGRFPGAKSNGIGLFFEKQFGCPLNRHSLISIHVHLPLMWTFSLVFFLKGDNFYDKYGPFTVSVMAQLNREAQGVPLFVPCQAFCGLGRLLARCVLWCLYNECFNMFYVFPRRIFLSVYSLGAGPVFIVIHRLSIRIYHFLHPSGVSHRSWCFALSDKSIAPDRSHGST